MTVVRELITRLGFEVDQASFAKAEKQLQDLQAEMRGQATTAQQTGAAAQKMGRNYAQAGASAQTALAQTSSGLSEVLGMLGRFGASLGISAMLERFVTLASDANETTNVLGELFGPQGQKDIQEWSATMGAAMGRSAYDLQAYASRLGSVLGPVTKNREQAEDMSKSLAGLAVDLASFFNTSDEQAMLALRSGLTGEYESLKRYGVVINDVTLQEIAHQKGIAKKVTAMTVAEKTELRYAAIMERSKKAQGDAARTGEGFANASKALAAQLKDVGVGMAMTVIPKLEKLVRFARDAVKWFNEMAKGSAILEAAMYTLAGVAAVLGAEFYSALILPALAIAALILLVDELLTMFRGGETVLGRIINAFAGDHAAEEWVLNTTAGFKILGEAIDESWGKFSKAWGDIGGVSGVLSVWGNALNELGIMIGDWAAWAADVFTYPFRKAGEALRALLHLAPNAQATPEASYERAAGRGLDAGAQGFAAWRMQREGERMARMGGSGAARDSGSLAGRRVATGQGVGAGTSEAAAIAAAAGTPATTAAPATVPATTAAPGTVTAPAAAPQPSAAASGAQAAPSPVIVPVSTAAPTININGGDRAAVLALVKQALADERKSQMAAVARQGGT